MSLHLLLLPPEIRNEVWAHVLTYPHKRFYLHLWTPPDALPQRDEEQAAWEKQFGDEYADRELPFWDPEEEISLLRTCRQMYNEGKIILWQQNTLGIKTGPDLKELENLWKPGLQDVQRVEIHFNPWLMNFDSLSRV